MRALRVVSIAVLSVVLALGTAPLAAAAPGSTGIGDPYFPHDGNGGYDVEHYDLALRYDPATGVLRGTARIKATATQELSRFSLDFVGLTVRSVRVQGAAATWSRTNHEFRITPAAPLADGQRFTVQVVYDGHPRPLNEPGLGQTGFFPTDDGFIVAGQPHGAASWFPVNDHPVDKASYTFRVTAPSDRQVVANGLLVGKRAAGRWTTWTWDAPDPMASYLATVDVGAWDTTAYKSGDVRYHDAIDPVLYEGRAAPTSGRRFAVAQQANDAYKRLTRQIAVPAGGATVGFATTRNTEDGYDYAMVEVHTVGQDDWTTLPDENGHTTQDVGFGCLDWPEQHPFLGHYQTPDPGASDCDPSGSTGAWWAASGRSDGPEEWLVDLGDYAGSTVELSITYVTDYAVQLGGVFVDDVVVSTGEGSTGFETGLDGWLVTGPPTGSPGNVNNWKVGTEKDGRVSVGDTVRASMDREPEIIRFLSGLFGRYPFQDAGGIVDGIDGLGFALETQTRPVYSKGFFSDVVSGSSVIVHELAHQWYGDSLAVHRWTDIWLNEGFATYAEWLWSEREGFGTTQEIFDFYYDDFIPDDDPWWELTIGDPGPDRLFEFPVYFRGAMTLQALRNAVGDEDFFRLLRKWATTRAGGNVTTAEFVALAEQVSGQQLDELFATWLYTPGRPELDAAAAAPRSGPPPALAKQADLIRRGELSAP